MNKIELMEYKKYKLGDICKIFGRIGFRGYTTEDLVLSPSYGAISLSPSNIVDGIMDLSKCTYISWAKYEESPEIKITPNDIVIVKTGNSYGRTAIIRNVEHPMTLNPQFVVLKDIQINPVYLAYFLKTDEFQKQIYGIVGGSAIPTLSQEDLASLIVRVPNENIQNTIADILDSLDGKIELNKLINDNLEEMAKQLYDYWFVQFDFPNEEGMPYKSSGGEMVWNEKLKREIPKGWEVKHLGDIIETNRGISYNTSSISGGGVPMINLASFNVNGTYKDAGIKTYNGSYTKEKVLKPFDLVLCNTQQTAIDFSKDIIGKAFLVPDVFEGDIVSSHHINTIKTEDYYKAYIAYLSNTSHFHKYTAGCCSGTNILGLDFNSFSQYKMEIPPVYLLEEFQKIIIDIVKRESVIIKENKTLTKLRDELLPLLMNGQATVNYHLSDD